MAYWVDLEKTISYQHDVILTEQRVTRMIDCWRVMLKGRRRGEPVAAYVFAADYKDVLELAGYLAAEGHLDWKPDAYPIKPKRYGDE